MKWFLLHEDEWKILVFPELRIQVKPEQFRVPDVTVIDQTHSLSIDRHITQPPMAVFEILSPEDSMVPVMAKLEEYSAMGIEQIWLINPEDGRIIRYRGTTLLLRTTSPLPLTD